MSGQNNNRQINIYAAVPGIVLGLYAIGLIFVLYVVYRTNEKENIEHFHRNTVKHANIAAYFIKERQQEINRFAKDPFILAYFQNRALGVKLGLIQNLLAIRNQCESLLNTKQYIDGTAIYSDFMLFDADGKMVTHVSRIKKDGKLGVMLGDIISSQHFIKPMLPGNLPDVLVISSPCRIRGQVVGWLAATVHWDDIFTLLVNECPLHGDVESGQTLKGTLVIFFNGSFLYSYGYQRFSQQVLRKIYQDFLMPDYPSESNPIMINGEAFLSSVYPIKLTPFCLGRIYPKSQIVHIYEPALIIWSLLIFLALLLIWMFWAFKKSVQAISLKYEVKEAEAIAKSKSDFLSIMSHEIRTPLNGLLGALFLMEEKDVVGSSRRFLTIAKESGQRLVTLIDEILQLSRLDGKDIHIRQRPFSPEKLVEDIADMSSRPLQGKNINLYTYVDCPEEVIGDETKIAQILMNLVSNALKFTKEGWVKIFVRCRGNGSSSSLVLTVEDTGSGIPKKIQKKIFDPFEQGVNSSYTALEGSGLGLSIVKKITDILGGHIELKSSENRGTRFTVTVPIHISHNNFHESVEKEQHHSRCLLLLSDKILQKIIVSYMKRWGIDVVVANLKKRNIIKQFGKVDIIITDCAEKYAEQFERSFEKQPKQCQKKIIEIVPPGMLPTISSKESYCNCVIESPVKFSRLRQCVLGECAESTGTVHKDHEKICDHLECLLVEDNSLNQMIISAMLKKIGIAKVDVAEKAEKALEFIASGHIYDFILMDCRLPGMDGFEATFHIRKMEEEYNAERTPVIALTAQVMDDIEARCARAGMDAYLSKPVTPARLIASIKELRNVMSQVEG